jgi:hypothetical protein
MNNAWLVWLLCAVFGASVARLIHADTVTAPLRDRWEVHWLGKIDKTLNLADSALQIARGATGPEQIGRLREEIRKRTLIEPGVSFWTFGARRYQSRPWTRVQDKLDRLESYQAFIGCRWCLPVWVFAVAVLWTWGRVYGFAANVFAPVDIPPDFSLIALVMGLRWVYAMIDLRLGRDH